MAEIDNTEQSKIIKAILVSRAKYGATIETIRSEHFFLLLINYKEYKSYFLCNILEDYEKYTGHNLGSNLTEALQIVQQIPGTYAEPSSSSWSVDSPNSNHIKKFVQEQREHSSLNSRQQRQLILLFYLLNI